VVGTGKNSLGGARVPVVGAIVDSRLEFPLTTKTGRNCGGEEPTETMAAGHGGARTWEVISWGKSGSEDVVVGGVFGRRRLPSQPPCRYGFGRHDFFKRIEMN
jgi:hypothetical protein